MTTRARVNLIRKKGGIRPSVPYERTSQWRRAPSLVAARADRARAGGPGIPASITKAARVGGVAGGLGTSPSQSTAAWNRTLDKLTQDYVESAQKQQIMNTVVEKGEEEDPGFIGGVLGGLMGSPLGSTVKQFGRPANALFQGLENLAGQEERTGFSGGDLAHSLGNFFSGVKSGWSYEEGASGAGQVYEALKENPTSSIGGGLSALEEWNPAVEQALAIGVGLTGEVTLDPTNWVMPAVPKVMRAGMAGRELTREALTETIQAAGRQGIEDGLAATPSTFGRSALSPDMIAARAAAAIDDAINATTLGVRGGGAPHTSTFGGPEFASQVSQRWGQDIINSISGPADEMVQRVLHDAANVTPWNIASRKAASRDFTQFWDELTAALKADPKWTNVITGGPTRVGARGGGALVDTSIDQVLAILKAGKGTKYADEIWERIRNTHYVALEPHIKELYKAVENPTTRTLGIRLGRGAKSTVVPVPVIGRAYAMANDAIGKIPGVKGASSFIYEKAFPAVFAGKISRASAYGVRGADNFMRDLEKVAKGFSKDEGKMLFEALGDHTFKFGDKRMDDALDWLRSKRDERFYEEAREGARTIDKANGARHMQKEYDPNYQYLHLKGGTKTERKRFLKNRKENWEKHLNYGDYDIAGARAEGLRPVDNAFEAMQLHYMDSANKITKAYLWQDIAANYGITPNATTTGISSTEMTARKLREVEYSKLSAAFKQATKDTGGKFYIPDEMYAMADEFEHMMDWSTAKMGRLGRSFSKVINMFKIWTTLPYPGFHVRNFMGDTAMGMLDGVPPTRYTETMKKYAASRMGRAANFEIIPGVDMSFNQLMKQFREEANSSYLKMDVGLTSTKTAGRIAGIGRKVGDVAKDFSDNRELLPRFTHYAHALREEAKALWNSGVRDTDVIMAQARDAALWRVNHYKFDYNALMPWERQLKSLAFPFYTYTRKAIPALIEQMFINPHYFQMTNRFMMDNDGSSADAFNYMNMPQWIRDLGFGVVTDEANPLAITGEILPTNVLDVLSSNSIKEASMDLLSTANPFIQAPIEQAMGRTLFNDQPIQGGNFDYLMSKVPFAGDIQSRFSNVPGMPGTSDNPVTGGGWSWDKFISDRLLGLGIPLRRVTEGQQEQQMEANWDQLVEDPMMDFNYGQDNWSVSKTGDGVFQVIAKGGEALGPRFATPQEAVTWATTNLPMVQHANIPSLHRPTNQDYAALAASQYP